MTSKTRIPPLLAPYLTTSQSAGLILLTSVLGASTNWLVLRVLLAVLSSGLSSPELREEADLKDGNVHVILVSFLRDWEFWKDGGRRLVGAPIWMLDISKNVYADERTQGLDLTRLVQKGRLVFADGLSSLFRENRLDQRPDCEGLHGQAQEMVLKDARLEAVEKNLLAAIQSVTGMGPGGDRLLLVLDGIDFLLAATDIGAQSVMDMLTELRMVRYLISSFNVLFPIPQRSRMLTLACSSMSTLQSSPPQPTTHSFSPLTHPSRLAMPRSSQV